jgi:hypothetical protein
MHSSVSKTPNNSKAVANDAVQKQENKEDSSVLPALPASDAATQFKQVANSSAAAKRMDTIQQMANNSRQAEKAAQLQQIADHATTGHSPVIQPQKNNTGLPDHLKEGVEKLSGTSLDDVQVHRNSDKPAQLNAYAYAQGNQIHLGPGQEKHLPHEAWHVAQQKQGRVRPTTQMKNGFQVNDNEGLEKEADTMGARANAFTPFNPSGIQYKRFTTSYLPMANAVQLSGVDLDVLKAGANITWDYIAKLLKQLNVTDVVQVLVDKLCNWFVSQIGIPTSIQEYLDKIAPWLAIADAVVAVIEKIPEAIRTAILYVVGFGIRKFSVTCLRGKITENHIHDVLTKGSDFASKLASVIHFLKNVVTSPTGALYSLFSVGLMSGIKSFLWGGGSDAGEEQDKTEEQDVKPEQGAEKAPMIDANAGFFWINAQAPELKKWKQPRDQKERAGMEMNARLGFKLFDNVIGTDNLKFQLPYGGDWETTLTDVTLLEDEIGINNVLKAGGIKASKIRFNQKGLQFINLMVDTVTMGEDIVKATDTHLSWSAGKDELILGGNANIKVFSREFSTRMNLTMGKDGAFKSGGLAIKMLDTIEMFSGRLQIVNPQLEGKFVKDQTPDVAVSGDIKLKLLEQLNMTSQAVKLAYTAQGFEGTVALLSVELDLGNNSTAIFEITNGKVSKEGFSADKVKLTYAFEPKKPATEGGSPTGSGTSAPATDQAETQPREGRNTLEKDKLPSLLPGFNMDWIKNAGLETLVVSGSAASVRLGRTGLEFGAVTKSIDKFSGKLFGVAAAYDGTKGTGSISGSKSIEPPMPSINLFFVPVPGIELGLGISTNMELAAELRGTLAKQLKEKNSPFTPWKIGGEAALTGTAGIEARISADIGSQFIASIGADLFGQANASLGLSAQLTGTALHDENSNEVKLSDKPEEKLKATYEAKATLIATLGARIRARAFYFYEKKLYEYRFKEWKLGEWSSKGTIFSDRSGDTNVETGPQTFDGKDKPGMPETQYEEVDSYKVINDLAAQGNKIDDKLLLQRLVYDIAEISVDFPISKRRELFQKVLGFAKNPAEVEAIGLEKMAFMNQRSANGSTPSLIMTRPEWEKYSTTKGLISLNTRKTVVPIDEAIEAYHATEEKAPRLAALEKLSAAVETYLKQSATSRTPMVARLRRDIRNEKDELSAMK